MIFICILFIYFLIYRKQLKKKAITSISLKPFLMMILSTFLIILLVILYKIFKNGWVQTNALLKQIYSQLLILKEFALQIKLTIGVFVLSYILLRVFALIKPFLLSLFKRKKGYISRIFNSIRALLNLKSFTFIFDILFFVFIFFLEFNPNFKYSYEKIANYGGEAIHQFHHADFFIAPIHEILNGKMLLVNVQAQYGILLSYIASIYFSFIGFSYSGFTLYNILLIILYTYLFYYFCLKLTKSRIFSLFTTLGFIKITFFRTFWQYEPYILPSTTAIRYFFDIVTMIFVYRLFNKYTKFNLYLTSFFIAMAFFYNTEIGLSILIAYGATHFVDLLTNFPRNIKFNKIATIFISLISSLVFFIILISLVTFLRIKQFPNWLNYFKIIFMYGRGGYDIAMPLIGSYYLNILVYALTFYLIIFKLINRSYRNLQILTFILVYGILSFFYYLIFNEPHHFVTIVQPAIILAVFILKTIFDNRSLIKKLNIFQQTIIITLFIFIISFIYSSPLKSLNFALNRLKLRYSKLPGKYYYWNNSKAKIYLSDNNGKDFSQSAEVIKKLNPEKQVVILSRYDTILMMMTNKTSLLDFPIIEYQINFVKEEEDSITKIKKDKPKYIFVFSDKYPTMVSWTIHEIWDAVKDNYIFVKNAGVVDVYKLKKN